MTYFQSRKNRLVEKLWYVMLPLLSMVVVACWSSENSLFDDDSTAATAVVLCKNPRPEMCTMMYLPVCATHTNGERKTYSNVCSACRVEQVLSYRMGACDDINSVK